MQKNVKRRFGQTLGALAVIGVLGAGCQNLDVINTINPDRARAAASPNDALLLIGGAYFPNFYQPTHGSAGGLNGLIMSYYGYQAADFTSTMAGTGSAVFLLDVLEPGSPLENASTICSSICQWGPRDVWQRLGRASSIPFDGLQIINDGMVFEEAGVNVTARAVAFSKFMQGLAWGYQAMIFDRVNVVPETVDLNTVNLAELNVSSLVSYQEALAAGLAAIDQAIQVAQQNPTTVTFPGGTIWFGTTNTVTNQQFIQLANTMAARLIVLSARTPAERATLDWAKVLAYTAGGVTPGSEVLFNLAGRTSQVLVRAQQNTTTGTTNTRWDYRTIGMADQSGAYQSWIAAPLDARDRFNIVTPDRRITGATPTSNGTYTCYRADNNGFAADRPFYLRSAYQWRRNMLTFGTPCTTLGGSGTSGTYALATADENNLLRAEALLRTGNVPGAVTEINKTRTRAHMASSLPPLNATTGAVPTVNGACVPRTDAGACGTVWTALRYERMVELAGVDAVRGWADSRGFGMLPDGFPYHSPVPGNILELYGLPAYTYGGVGGEAAAVYAPVN